MGPVVVHGRIDRLERNGDAAAVVDYKTGAVPSRRKLATGESVQLTTYALGVEHATELYFVDLAGVATGLPGGRGDAPSVAALQTLVADRIEALAVALERGASVRANGDEAVCRHCAYDGLCRVGTWDDA